MTDDIENRPDLNTGAEWEEPRAIPEVGLADLWRLSKIGGRRFDMDILDPGNCEIFGADGTKF
jgi:hypothetical protein